MPATPLVGLLVALGIGLLVGGERERRKGARGAPTPAGLRTFAIASIAGAISLMLGGPGLLAIVTGAVALFVAIEAHRIQGADPGVTTELALVLTVLLGALAVRDHQLAAGLGVTLAILLAARTPMHRFVSSVLGAGELRDLLIFAGATLVILPLLPNRAMGPFGALNPHSIWVVVVLVLAIGGAGHVAVRALGAKFGLPLAGLASGFVSSTATIGAMGARAGKLPAVLTAAAAGAVLSTVATVVQMAVVIGATSASTLNAMAGPLACAGVAAVAYGAIFTVLAVHQPAASEPEPDRAFNPAHALLFAATLALILVASAALRARFGEAGTVVAAAVAGLLDTHAAAISIASLVASGRMTAQDAVLPILAGFTTNTITKLVFAGVNGPRFAMRVIPGLVLVAAAAWLGVVVMHLAK
jgi:uncharacterized membrane protein (DUF4010 family)